MNHTIVTEQSGEPLTQHRDDGTGYLTEADIFIDVFKMAHQHAAALLLGHRNVQQPTPDQSEECMREVAMFFREESDRYLKRTR